MSKTKVKDQSQRLKVKDSKSKTKGPYFQVLYFQALYFLIPFVLQAGELP